MKHKKRMEFKKKLAIFSVIIIISVIIGDFILAFMGLVVPETMSYTVVTAAFGFLVSYAASSALEKNSRNKYGIDENGIPFANTVGQVVNTVVDSVTNTDTTNQGG